MADAAFEWELADVRRLGLDQLRDWADETLQAGIHRLLHTLDGPCARDQARRRQQG